MAVIVAIVGRADEDDEVYEEPLKKRRVAVAGHADFDFPQKTMMIAMSVWVQWWA